LDFLEKPIEQLRRSKKPIPNLEVLRVYRETMKMTCRFTWCNEEGRPWKEILRASARAEFEQLRHEKDPLIIGKTLLTWQEANKRIHEKVNKTQMEITSHV